MSIINLIAILTDVGMWVTPRDYALKVLQRFWSYPHLNIRQTTRFAPFLILNNDKSKNGKAARFSNEPLLFTGWHKAALEQN
jgi:hypothetical protein